VGQGRWNRRSKGLESKVPAVPANTGGQNDLGNNGLSNRHGRAGLSFLMAVLHTIWFRTGSRDYRRLTRFFGTLLRVNIALGR
jgi:hypothetical protein